MELKRRRREYSQSQDAGGAKRNSAKRVQGSLQTHHDYQIFVRLIGDSDKFSATQWSVTEKYENYGRVEIRIVTKRLHKASAARAKAQDGGGQRSPSGASLSSKRRCRRDRRLRPSLSFPPGPSPQSRDLPHHGNLRIYSLSLYTCLYN